MNEAEQETLTTPSTEIKRPERLSDEQMNDLLAAFGNHEAKALTLVAMGSGNIFTDRNLYRTIINAQGETPSWRINHGGPFGYCTDSLSPIGLVTKETLNEDLTTYGYQITDFGKETGIPLAGLLLSFSERHNIPLNKIFSTTNSNVKLEDKEEKRSEYSKKRAPGITRKILYEIITRPSFPLRTINLAENIKEDPNAIASHLQRLNEEGLIEYVSTNVNQPYTEYRFRDDNPQERPIPVYKNYRTLSNAVYQILKSSPRQFLSSQEIMDSLQGETIERWADKKQLRSSVSGVLKNLEKEGRLVALKFTRDIHSEINLSEEQKAVISELVEILDRFQDQDPQILKEGKRLAFEILTTPKRVSSLMQRARLASNIANNWPVSETVAAILSIIQAKPEGITISQIRDILKKKYDRQIGASRIRRLTSKLLGEGSIHAQTKGRQKTFSPNSPQD